MKYLICSDIHGDLDSARLMLELKEKEGAERIIILGDILYHGPRNDLPKSYMPKEVIKLLNENKNILLCVRDNCDTEVDQMVLDFPILADYAYLECCGLGVFLTHGHNYNTENPPKLRRGEILVHGHTHLPSIQKFGDGNYYINPGSIAIPKGGNPRSYMILENAEFAIKDIDGNILNSISFS